MLDALLRVPARLYGAPQRRRDGVERALRVQPPGEPIGKPLEIEFRGKPRRKDPPFHGSQIEGDIAESKGAPRCERHPANPL